MPRRGKPRLRSHRNPPPRMIPQIASYSFRPSSWTLPGSWCKIPAMITSSCHYRRVEINPSQEVIQTNRSRSISFTQSTGIHCSTVWRDACDIAAPGAPGLWPIGRRSAWYHPYPAPHAVLKPAVVQFSQPVALHQHQSAVTSVSSAQGAEKLPEKRPTTQPRIADVAVPRERN